ncbi:MAG: hypothetical protein WAN93_00630 [Solirubrobacteraceae bacterium]
MIVLLISTTWFAALLLVVSLCRISAHGDRKALAHTERSPRLLDAPPSWEQVLSVNPEALRVRRSRSEAATAEHVGDGSQENLYVRP